MVAKAKAKKTTPAKKKTSKPSKAPKKAAKAPAKASLKAKSAASTKAKVQAKGVGKATKGPAPKEEKVIDKKRAKAQAAMSAALAEGEEGAGEEEEFDPEKFFALSGGQGLIKSHVMRKERVDLNVVIRYRFLKGPLVFNAELINLSKGGLALKTTEVIKAKTVIKIEIPLPHTSELFAVQAEVVWSAPIAGTEAKDKNIHTGLRFMPMSLAKQAVINQFIQQRRDEVIMAKIGLDRFVDSVPVAGLD